MPGSSKTLLVRTEPALDGIWPHPVRGPSLDIIGTNIISEAPDGKRVFSFQAGPLFTQIVLADEINRATPKTQSALLEAMQEHSVTIGGTIHKLQEPFLVMATQNPIEQEGTYPLPEAQLDRFFFKLIVNYSGREEMATILDRTTRGDWPKAEKVMDGPKILELQQLVREVLVAPPAGLRRSARAGDSSPRRVRNRGDQPLYPLRRESARRRWCWPARCGRCLEGRYNVSFEDVRRVYLPALRHRFCRTSRRRRRIS